MNDPPKKDDFETAFAQFAVPDDKQPADADDKGAAAASDEGEKAADAAAATDAGDKGSEGGKGEADAGADGGAAAAPADGAQGAQDGGAGEEGAGGNGADAAAAADAGTDDGKDIASDAGPSPDDILAGLKKLVGEVGQAEEGGDQKPGGDGQQKEEPKPLYSKDEEEFLSGYDKDWSDVARGESLKRRAEYKELLEYVFSQVAEFIKPLHETTEAVAERTFRSELTTSVPDYSDKLRSSVVDWVKTQPAYLQVAYNHVITEGSVDEVKDLIDRYRSSTGQAKPAPAKTGKENELSDEAKKAAAALAPVDSKRSGVQAPSDPSDFDDAWKQAAIDLKD